MVSYAGEGKSVFFNLESDPMRIQRILGRERGKEEALTNYDYY